MIDDSIVADNSANWSVQTMGWMMVVSWFCASLLSQAMYMATNGVPYGPEILMIKMGSFYWAVVGLELMLWAGLGIHLVKRVMRPKMIEQTVAAECPV